MLAGESEAGLRGVFAAARALAPSVIFIDEVDALAPARGGGGGGGGGLASTLAGGGGGDEGGGMAGRIVTVLLTLMDGVSSSSGEGEGEGEADGEGGGDESGEHRVGRGEGKGTDERVVDEALLTPLVNGRNL